MSIRWSVLLAVFVLNFLTTGLMAAATSRARLLALEGQFTDKLNRGAGEAEKVTRDYGAELARVSTPSPAAERLRKEFESIAQDASHLRISNIYTLARSGDSLYFTSNYESTAKTGSPEAGDQYKSFPPELLRVFDTGQELILDYKDEYGRWHSLFRPITLPGGERYVIGVDISSEVLEHIYEDRMSSTLTAGVVTLLLSMLLGIVFVNRLMRRVEALVATTRSTVETSFKPDEMLLGRLKALSARSKDEIAVLSDTIIALLRNLDTHIQKLTKVEGELQAAKDIQTSLLPRIVPPLTSCPEFDVQADLKPAREVGGDLYDCFWTDEHHLFFAVGDVSDKGVSAALLMTATMALLKTEVTPGRPLNESIDHINALLAENNEQMNFVTLFCGVLDVRTGEIEYCSAGHLPPCLLPDEGSPRLLDMASNPALGIFPDCQYVSGKLSLRRDDRLFLYTDGVTEAMNVSREQYSEGRLLSALDERKGTERELLDTVLGSVRVFAGGAPQSDDIAMLVLRYRGEQAHHSARQGLLDNPRIKRNVQGRPRAA